MKVGQNFLCLGAGKGFQCLDEGEVGYVHFVERERVLSHLGEEIRCRSRYQGSV